MLSFFSMLAIGVMALAIFATLLPWLQGRGGAAAGVAALPGGLHLESALFGLTIGLFLGEVARCHWADIPRRVVTWILIRERQFFYYALIGGCIGVLLFY